MFSESVAGIGVFTEEATQTPALVRQHFSVARAARIGSGTQSGEKEDRNGASQKQTKEAS